MRYLLFLFLLCIGTAHAHINIVTTSPMTHSLTSQIYGNPQKIKILSCAQTGCQNQLSVADTQRLQNAQLVVWLGTEKAVEKWLQDHPKTNSFAILTQTPDLQTRPSEMDSQAPNPYVWLSPSNTLEIILTLTKRLSELDPKNTKRFERNLKQYSDRWEFFDSYKLPDSETYPVVVSLQEGMEYMFEYLGLNNAQTIPIDERRRDRMVSDVALRAQLKQLNPVCVFVGPNFSKRSLANLNLPKSMKIIHIDVEGNEKDTGPYLYKNVMRPLFAHIYTCLDMTLPRHRR